MGHRRGLDPALLWLWQRLAATGPIGPLPWQSPYAVGAALKRQEKKKRERKNKSCQMNAVLSLSILSDISIATLLSFSILLLSTHLSLDLK